MSRAAVSLPDIVEAARQFELASEESLQLVARLEKVAEGLRKEWSGEAQEAFFAQHGEWQTLMQAQVLLLTRISTQLLGLAERYQRADG